MSEKAIAALGTDVERLADEYEMDASLVARVCDERLDKSGALLGRVRDVVRKRGKSGGYPLAPAHTLDLDSPETVERLAAVEHDQWMTWARSVMSADDVTIGPERLARWQSYMVPYADLSEPVKEHDRKWARGVLAALREGTA